MSDSIIHLLWGALAIIFIRVVFSLGSNDGDIADTNNETLSLPTTVYWEQKNVNPHLNFTHRNDTNITQIQNSTFSNYKASFENIYTTDLVSCYDFLYKGKKNLSSSIHYAVKANSIVD